MKTLQMLLAVVLLVASGVAVSGGGVPQGPKGPYYGYGWGYPPYGVPAELDPADDTQPVEATQFGEAEEASADYGNGDPASGKCRGRGYNRPR